jgi:DNA-binding transcriptional ArsR family regulator
MTYALALAALADPTRRQVFEHLRAGPRAVGELADEMPVSRPAVSQHLKVLKDAGLVADRAEGARRVYYIDPQGLGALRKWLDESWGEALGALQAEFEASPAFAKAFASAPPPLAPLTRSPPASRAGGRARTRSARCR